MFLSCESCHRDFVASKKKTGDHALCTKCRVAGKTPQMTKLGLHPALEKKWAFPERPPYSHDSHKGSTAHKMGFFLEASPRESSAIPKIPGFEISYQVGQGAMGSVYRARQIKTGNFVAIKVLSRDLSLRSDLVARFEREAYALKSLKNKNVVTIIDAGQVEDTHYLAMEFVDGITLRTRINRGNIGVDEACFIMQGILNGLKAAHKNGIIHRDLKPENVLLTYSDADLTRFPDRVVLVDFGLVGIGGLAFDPHPNLTRSRVTMGTLNYMAPEQHIDAKRVDQRSDLYSAGVILFEMISGDLPLGRYLMPSERGMNTPPALDVVLSKALTRTIEERFACADDFLKELKTVSMAGALEQRVFQGDGNRKAAHLVTLLKTKLFPFRHVFLLLISGLFFYSGIKLSLRESPPATVVKKPQ